MKTSRRICFLINSLEGGGAERAMCTLLRHLNGHVRPDDVDLVLLDAEEVAQEVPDWLTVTTLDGQRRLLRSYRQLRAHWKEVGAPDVCVSYLTRSNCLNVWLQRSFGHRAVISERVQTSSHLANARLGVVTAQLVRRTYRHASTVIPVSDGVAADLSQNFAVPAELQEVIGNPIDLERINHLAQDAVPPSLPDRYVVAMGRLVKAKNFSSLLAAYAACDGLPDLVLLGQGPLEATLRDEAAQLGITARVHFAGFVPNPYPIVAKADFLVSASRAEGFPNTLIEAMCLGVPVVATDCPTGPAEVLGSQGEHGLLVPMDDAGRLAAAMAQMASAETRADYARRARARSQAFGVNPVVSAYLSIIRKELVFKGR